MDSPPNSRSGTQQTPAAPPLVGVDVGGTFTDFVVLEGAPDARTLRIHKLSTTPDDQSRAIVAGLSELGLPAAQIVHGMTVATNALLERKGARTALLTTQGFGDVLLIGRQNRPFLYRLSQERPPLLVADNLRLEIAERLDSRGQVVTPLDEAAMDDLARTLRAARAESLAIVFLFSFRNPAHEQRAADLLRARLPDLPLSLSSEILPEYREYERTATTVVNAYVQPLVARYLARLESALQRDGAAGGVRIMQSSGGAIGLRQAAEQAARLVLSGPAGGVVGAFAAAEQAADLSAALSAVHAEQREPVQLITLDMGGTSTDVALCAGAIPTTAESMIGDLPLRLPVIDIHTVGAGGGSIAWLDGGGALHVGPQSAGALPGPAAYGRGGSDPTVTDANLVLGRLDPGGFLGGHGDVALDAEAARRALARLGAQLGVGAEAAALGVLRVANATMERALRRVSVEQGHDPRLFTLLPFGGAGPLHACDLAGALGVRRVLVPPFPGVLSAYGMLVAGISTDASVSILRPAHELLADFAPIHAARDLLVARVQAVLRREGVADPELSAALDLRYRGQSYELTVPLALAADEAALASAVEQFHLLHARRYGFDLRTETVEAVTLRLRAQAPGAEAALPLLPEAEGDASRARLPARPVWFDLGGPVQTPAYDRTRLRPGHSFGGPAVVHQYDTTTVLPPDWSARVDPIGNLLLERDVSPAGSGGASESVQPGHPVPTSQESAPRVP